ncbi:MAG: small-conductance mechanosensitive channel [Candidatus Paceibacteria bacterium]|jgi:small-conductance mechanosensitive channel
MVLSAQFLSASLALVGEENPPWYEQISTLDWISAAVIFVLGWGISKILSIRIAAYVSEHVSKQTGMLLRRGILYAGLLVSLALALHQLSFSLGVVLGAAGVLTVAVGFASQTSASNIISGLFLLGERPFSVGDVIQINGTTGEVLSIDLLAIHLRTFDNIFVRIPNESVIKSEVRTLSRFPIRRYDLQIGIAYKEDIERVRLMLLKIADDDPLCLEEPTPLIIFQNFGDSSINLQLSVWASREKYLELRNRISSAVKRRFDEEGIEIPFPHRTLYAGSATGPLPVELSNTAVSAPDA